MKTFSPLFDLTPEVLRGMDGSSIINKNIASLHEELSERRYVAGDAVDFAIMVSQEQADWRGEDAEQVLQHIRYIILQLQIFAINVEREIILKS